jgi:hypothetical protein
MYSYQPKGWLDPHTVLAPDVHTHTYITPHTTTVRHTKPGVEWGRVASSFPPPYYTQPGNEVHYLAKVGSTNLIYLHHPQTDNKNWSACILVVGGCITIYMCGNIKFSYSTHCVGNWGARGNQISESVCYTLWCQTIFAILDCCMLLSYGGTSEKWCLW